MDFPVEYCVLMSYLMLITNIKNLDYYFIKIFCINYVPIFNEILAIL